MAAAATAIVIFSCAENIKNSNGFNELPRLEDKIVFAIVMSIVTGLIMLGIVLLEKWRDRRTTGL
jgi:hypothetical protein